MRRLTARAWLWLTGLAGLATAGYWLLYRPQPLAYVPALNPAPDYAGALEQAEGMVARRAATCTDKKLRDRLKQACQKMEQAAQSEDMEIWLEADRLFHNTIFEMAGNRRAQRVVSNLNDQWHRLRIGFVAMQGRVNQSITEHQAIAQCILDGDSPQAEQKMQSHLDNVRKDLVNLLVNVLLPYAQNGV